MSADITQEISNALTENRPTVLFLGQRYTAARDQIDPLVTQISEYLGRTDPRPTWSSILKKELSEESYTWIADRFKYQALPERLTHIFQFSWSAVFTSSIDPRIVKQLETRGRIPESITSNSHFPRVPRSRARPGIHYLFGRAEETFVDTTVPRSEGKLQLRCHLDAAQLAQRIPETMTSLGLLVVAGLDDDDWLSTDTLLAPLCAQGDGARILWFLAGKEPPQSHFFDSLIKNGNLITDKRSLEEALLEIDGIQSNQAIFQPDSNTITLAKDKFLRLPPSLRLQVDATAAVVDDTWTDKPDPLDPTQEAEAFRRFHGNLDEIRGLVKGIAREFSIKRDFEEQAWQQIEQIIKRPGQEDNLVIIHGQSGIGKSLAIARLAFVLRRELQVPVLYSWPHVPLAAGVDVFCEIAEQNGANCTVILCDCNSDVRRYRELLESLRSRGRRILIIGTCYKIEKENRFPKTKYIEAPTQLSKREIDKIKRLFSSFYSFSPLEQIDHKKDGNHLLALLYRCLSASRSHISQGVNNEAHMTEELIRQRASNVPCSQKGTSQLAEQLRKTGLTNGKIDIFKSSTTQANTDDSIAGRFIDYVMVPGKLDCPVPLNLLLRAIRAVSKDLDYHQIYFMFNELDLFRWRMADNEGNDLLVSPRLQLEAELICSNRLSDRSYEVKCIVDLIRSARVSSMDSKSERVFLLELLEKIRRDGSSHTRYEKFYVEFARALTDLRTKSNVHDASLMLQESVFRRDTIFISDKTSASDSTDLRLSETDRERLLDEAREVIDIALKEISDGKLSASKRTRHHLSVEQATIYCYQAYGLASRGADAEQIMSHYYAARVALTSAVSAANSYHPIDIAIWAPALIIQKNVLCTEQKQELLADIYSTFDSFYTDTNLQGYSDRFEERRLRIAQLFRDNSLEDSAFENLERLNPATAYYLRARSFCSDDLLNPKHSISPQMKEEAHKAANYLEARYKEVSCDTRALQLLIQLRWITESGDRLLQRDRCVIPKHTGFWKKMLEYVQTFNKLTGNEAKNIYRFLEAVLQWLQGNTAQAREQFNQLARDSDFQDNSRVIRRLLLISDEPEGYRGTVQRLRKEGNWSISVKGFDGTIDLEARQFSGEDLRIGRELRRFNIAFNFLGPIADPIRNGVKA